MKENIHLFLALLFGVLTSTVMISFRKSYYGSNRLSFLDFHWKSSIVVENDSNTYGSIVKSAATTTGNAATLIDTTTPRRLDDSSSPSHPRHHHHHHHEHITIHKNKTRIAVLIPTQYGNSLQRRYINNQFSREGWSDSDVRIFWIFGNKVTHHHQQHQQQQYLRDHNAGTVKGDKTELKGKREVPSLPLDLSSVYHEKHMSKENMIITPCLDVEHEEVLVKEHNVRGKLVTVTLPLADESLALKQQLPLNESLYSSASTCKLYWAMKHINHYFEAEYAIRSSDTAYLNIRKFLSIESSLPKSTALWIGREATSDSLTPASIAGQCHPKLQSLFGLSYLTTNYMIGMGYILTCDIVQLIGNWNILPHLVTPDIGKGGTDDVMLGMYLMTFQVQRISRPDLFAFRSSATGKHDVILLQHMETRDWGHIDDDGSVNIVEK